MDKTKKIIYWISIVFIGLWLLMPFLRMILDLEFASNSIKYDYHGFLFIAVPIAILSTLFGTIKPQDNDSVAAGKIGGTIIAALGSIFIMFISIFGYICGWTDEKTLYINKENPNTKIIIRSYGCGALDSDLPKSNIYKVRYFTSYFLRSTEIDTADIDKTKWIKID